MSKKDFYLRKFKGDISDLAKVKLDREYQLSVSPDNENKYIDNDGNEVSKILFVGDRAYKMDKKLPDDYKEDENGNKVKRIYTVIGFLETAKKSDKQSGLKKNDDRLIASLIGFYPVTREKLKMTKVIGYIRVAGSDTFVAVTKPISLMPLIIFGIALLIALLLMNMPKEVLQPEYRDEFKNGETSQGEIIDKKTETDGRVNYFNFNLNVTPTIFREATKDDNGNDLEPGSMNIRIQNNKDKNTNPCVVVVTLLGEADEYGTMTEQFEEPIKIWESPLIEPGSFIENAVVDQMPDPGRYSGRATYTIYQWDEVKETYFVLGVTSAKLDVVVK